MYNTQPVCKPRLDVAEKARAYDRHTHALKYNKHIPISTQPPLAPSVRIYERARNEERELIKKKDRINAKIIDQVWKRAHGIPIPDDTSQLSKAQTARRSGKKPWSSLLLEKETLFPNKQEQILNSSRSIHKKTAQVEASASTFSREPESGMRVNYHKPKQVSQSPQKSRPNTAKMPRAKSDDMYDIKQEDEDVQTIKIDSKNTTTTSTQEELQNLDEGRPSAILRGLLNELDVTDDTSQDIVNLEY